MMEDQGVDEQVSVLAVGTTLLRHRARVIRWMCYGALLALALVLFQSPTYVSAVSFVPEVTDASRSGLANLAGQFGVLLPTGNQRQSPEFYATLLKSRILLSQVARDTLSIPERGTGRVSMLDLLEVPAGNPTEREEEGVRELAKIIVTAVSKNTGIVDFTVRSRWPTMSYAVASSLVRGLNDYNQRSRQLQAALERKFVEGRLVLARSDLRAAEDRVEQFLKANRQYASSPELTFAHDRLERELAFQQQVYTSLTQAFEEVRIREVRDVPTITVIEPPAIPTLAEPRRAVLRAILGLLLGGMFGAVMVFVIDTWTRRYGAGDPEANEFARMLREVKGDLLDRVPFHKRRSSS